MRTLTFAKAAIALASVTAWADLPQINGHLLASSPGSLQLRLLVADTNGDGGDPACRGFSFTATVDVAADGTYSLPPVDLTGATCHETVLSVTVLDKKTGRDIGVAAYSDSFSTADGDSLSKRYTEGVQAIRETQIINPTDITFEAKGMTLQQFVDRTVARFPELKAELKRHHHVTWEIGINNGNASAYYGSQLTFVKDSDVDLSGDCNCFAKSADGGKSSVTRKIPGETGFVSEALVQQGQHQFFGVRITALARRSIILRFNSSDDFAVNVWVVFETWPNPDLNNPNGNSLVVDLNSLQPSLNF